MSTPAERRGGTPSFALSALMVCLAAVVPYLSTVDDYFVRDDFGVVQLLASKPATYFPRWFVSPWMDNIWRYVPDEIRPFPAVSYQLTALGGAASPVLHHLFNIALHAANGVLVLAMARVAAGLQAGAALLAALVFVLLPVQAESVAWITGRVDSMPAFFYIACFLVFVRWRPSGSSRLHLGSLALFFVALFTKQTTITMVGTLLMWDLLVGAGLRRVVAPRWLLSYAPFVAMTAGFLALRYALFGHMVREERLTPQVLVEFGRLVERHLAHVVVGDVTAAGVAWAVLAASVVAAAALMWRVEPVERRRIAGVLVYFGPVWWAIGVAPIAVAGYESPRHVYLASAGWAIVVGVLFQLVWAAGRPIWRRAAVAASTAIVAWYAVGLHHAVREWNETAAVSHRAVQDVRAAALASPAGSLLIAGVPTRSWEWAMPFSIRPPFTRLDLTKHVFIVTPWLLHCCRVQWLGDTRRVLQGWRQSGAAGRVLVMRWDEDTGALATIDDREYPPLRALASVLVDLTSRETLDEAIRRLVEELPERRARRP